MADRSPRPTRPISQYRPPGSQPPSRLTELNADDNKTGESLAIPELAPPRRDSMAGDKGKLKRVHSEVEADGQGNGSGGGGSGMDIDEDDEAEESEQESAEEGELEHNGLAVVETEEGHVEFAPRDPDLEITERKRKMHLGDEPRFYAKIARSKDQPVYDKTRKKWTSEPKAEEEVFRMPDHPPVLLPRVDLRRLQTPGSTHRLSERELVRLVVESPTILPGLKKWAYRWLDPDSASQRFYQKMRGTFPLHGDRGTRWEKEVQAIASHGPDAQCPRCRLCRHALGANEKALAEKDLLCVMAQFARETIASNWQFCSTLSKHANEPELFTARLMLTVWEDVEENQDGFFRILLKSELARLHRPEVRKAFRQWYVIHDGEGEVSPSVPTGVVRSIEEGP